MKIDIIKTSIVIALSLLIAYASYILSNIENKLLLSIGSFVFIAITLIMTFGINFEQTRTTINIRVVSGIFFIIALISNIVFLFIKFNNPIYIMINGILFLVFLLMVFSIKKEKL